MHSGIWNAQYVDDQYDRWVRDPGSVLPGWRAFFEGFALGAAGAEPAAAGDALAFQARADALIERYRDLGHLMACLDPLSACPTSHPLLDPQAFGLAAADLDREVHAPDLRTTGPTTLRAVLEVLRDTYCRSVGVEYTHLQDPKERAWLRDRMEPVRNRAHLTEDEKRRLLEQLCRAGRFEEFLQRRYPGQTRFSLEGAEALIPLLDAVFGAAAGHGVEEVLLGMAHRGRLNVQANLLGESAEALFCQFEATYDPEALAGGGDVKYHSGFVGSVQAGGRTVRVVLPENPSHLEAVNPVVEGIARALQDRLGSRGPARVLPVLVHGDAAFPGQGVVAETLNLARLDGYSTGGTVHVVLNNQIGYTTPPDHARSTRYATDLAKMLMVPIFHVHGEDAGAGLHVARLALAYRMEFGKDSVVDLICYRRHGHNEGDEPYFTQPLLYRRIRERPPGYELYGRDLVQEGLLSEADRQRLLASIDGELETAYQAARAKPCPWSPPKPWDEEGLGDNRHSWAPLATGFPEERLREISDTLGRVPEGFSLHAKLRRILERRSELASDGKGIDWAWAEALALGTLLLEGVPVRLSGEDSRRGTFSQRHSVWFDTETGAEYTPLGNLSESQAPFRAYDSPLSEAAVLGFEYGYSVVTPAGLVLWEAQYGDFANGAQVILDQFVASGEAKWRRSSRVVLLLPHGYEGQGPDHSTARPERYLQLCAEDNLQVCQPTTPAQYFHLLRRQVKQTFRKPLIVMTPKSLLRHPAVVSSLPELASGSFRPVLPDPGTAAADARRVLLCSGKVYYDLLDARERHGTQGVALARLEQLYPFPENDLRSLASAHREDAEWCWIQEEPRNMGAWAFVQPRLEALLARAPRYVGRPEAASPATGYSSVHRQEQTAVVEEALVPQPARNP